MLVFPMNAFPWVINGVIEARVSAKRIASVLLYFPTFNNDLTTSVIDEDNIGNNNNTNTNNHTSNKKHPNNSSHKIKTNNHLHANDTNTKSNDNDNDSLSSFFMIPTVYPVLPASVLSPHPRSHINTQPQSYTQNTSVSDDFEFNIVNANAINNNHTKLILNYVKYSYTTQSLSFTDGHNNTSSSSSCIYNACCCCSCCCSKSNRNKTQKLTNKVDHTTNNNNNTNTLTTGYTLGPISITFRTNHSYLVTGSVASGKTTFFLGLLQEIPNNAHENNIFWQLPELDSGWQLGTGYKFIYCLQSPYLHTGTVRDNILMGNIYDEHKYNEIINGCCLNQDFNATNWPLHDLTLVGEAGSTLSGGQKLRIGGSFN